MLLMCLNLLVFKNWKSLDTAVSHYRSGLTHFLLSKLDEVMTKVTDLLKENICLNNSIWGLLGSIIVTRELIGCHISSAYLLKECP